MWVQGYYPVYRVGNPAIVDLPFTRVTHVAYFNIAPTATGTLNTNVNGEVTTDLASLVTNCHANNVKVLITVGGASAAPDTTWRAAVGATYRATFVSNLVSFVSTWNLDGIDLDWEPFDTESDGTNFATFVSDLRTSLPAGKTISMFVATTPAWKRTLCNTIEANIDRFNLSTYDFSYGETATMHDSPLYSGGGQPAGASAHDAVTNFLAAGVAASKLNISMSQYTAQWTGSSGLYTSGTFNPGNAEQYDGLAGATATTPPTGETYDSTAKGAYIYSGGIFKSYNNIATVQAKVDYVNANGLGGIGIWELGQGYFSVGTPHYPLLEPFDGELGLNGTATGFGTMTGVSTITL